MTVNLKGRNPCLREELCKLIEGLLRFRTNVILVHIEEHAGIQGNQETVCLETRDSRNRAEPREARQCAERRRIHGHALCSLGDRRLALAIVLDGKHIRVIVIAARAVLVLCNLHLTRAVAHLLIVRGDGDSVLRVCVQALAVVIHHQ